MSTLDEAQLIERASAFPFDLTVERLTAAINDAGMTVFAVIDHAANAREAGLVMPASIVLIYGKAAGGTPIMLAAPRSALDLPLRVLVRHDAEGGSPEAGAVIVSFHPIAAVLETLGTPAALAARLAPAQDLILKAIQP